MHACSQRRLSGLPGTLLVMGSFIFPALGGAAPSPYQDAVAVPSCKTNLTKQLKALNVPGIAAAIVKNGRLVCAGAAGMANMEANVSVRPETLFLVASVSKTVTATALMQLFERGKFGLDDDVSAFLPFKLRIPASPSAPVTFRQLLTHTASIRDNQNYINCPFRCGYGTALIPFVTKGADSPLSLQEFTQGYFRSNGAYYDAQANFFSSAPGEKSHYANMGITLVGYLVESLAGMPFDKYCQEHIFNPLGMRTTSWRLARADHSLLAMPYNRTKAGYAPYGHYGEPDYPDGMLRTSVLELAKFLRAYMAEGKYGESQILKSATIVEMLTTQTSLDEDQGLVWYADSIRKRTVWGHEGSDHGACAAMWLDPEAREGVIVMANGACDDAEKLVAKLFEEADDY